MKRIFLSLVCLFLLIGTARAIPPFPPGGGGFGGGASLNLTTTGLTAGHAYYIAATTGTFTEADATSSSTLPLPSICVAISATSCMKAGTFTTTGLTVGSVYYVPVGVGLLTATRPATSGNQVEIMGIATSTTTLEVMPQLLIVQVP